jgi:hypothetical protein
MHNLTGIPQNCLFNIFSYLGHKDYWKLTYLSSKKFAKISEQISYHFTDKEKYDLDFIKKYILNTKYTRFYLAEKTRIIFTGKFAADIFNNSSSQLLSLKYVRNFYLDKNDCYDNFQPPKYDPTNSNTFMHSYRFSGCVMDIDIKLKEMLEHMPYIESLNISLDIKLSSNENNIFSALSSTIQIVNLCGIQGLNDESIDLLTQYVPNIKRLYTRYSIITNNSLKIIRDRCKYIERIILYGSNCIDNLGLGYLGNIKTLRVVDLTMNSTITNTGINTLVSKNPNLTHLFLRCMRHISRSAVESMETYLKAPKYIDLSYTLAVYTPLNKLRKMTKLVVANKVERGGNIDLNYDYHIID